MDEQGKNQVGKSIKKEVYEKPSTPSAAKPDLPEKCCVIVTFKSPSVKAPLEEIPILKRIKPRTILFPFTEKNVAMVVFETPADAEQAFSHVKDFGIDADLNYLAEQAVSNVQAYLSEKFLDLFDDKEKLYQGLMSRSGAKVQMMENGKWVLSGCLTQIDLAHKFLKEECKILRGAKLESSAAKSFVSESASHLQQKKTKSPLQNDDNEDQNSTDYSNKPQNKADMNKPDKKVPEEVKEKDKNPSLKQQQNVLTKTISMSESKYLKFLRVFPEFQTQSGHDDEYMGYEDNKLVLRGSSSFVKDISSQIYMMETEMTEKSVVFEKQEEYHAALQDLQKNKLNEKLGFCFHHDDANLKLTLFGFSRESVEKGLTAVKTFQKPTSKHVKEEKNEQVLTFTTNGLKVKFYTGSIIGLDVDCIVSSATCYLENKSGIAKAIADKAGREYQEDCENCVSKLSGGYLKESQCCVTSAGSLSYKHVIHVLGPVWSAGTSGLDFQSSILKQAVLSVLIKADELQMKSVAIPAISAA
ncbi:uncharacterized protein LOC133180423 [Saccostrea echinata]|uniref:uncharacterized protein LOC133180423 n=1 Tax=Saccostrea echinata TaxID=191078 RepID=UPI002A838542|nr:uncharacterized protein LOC133180423 [Saccostrea echinata]